MPPRPGERAGKPRSVLLVEVSPDDYSKLLPLVSVPEIDSDSWATGHQKHNGIVALLHEAEIATPLVENIRELRISLEHAPTNLAAYFQEFAQRLLEHLDQNREEIKDGAVLILNLLPFYLSRSRLDKIAAAIFEHEAIHSRFGNIVILLRNIDWLVYSNAFQEMRAAKTWSSTISVADLRGFVTSFVPASEQETTVQISRDAFRLLLKTDHKTIYRSLIFETNCFIGHFILQDSHVRTHYDLTSYIKKDNVWEFMFHRLRQEIGPHQRILVIGVGLEYAAVSILGIQLKAALGEDLTVSFIPALDYYSPSDSIDREWSQLYDLAVIVTDIINTGKTVEPWVAELTRTANGRPVKIFSIAKMRNSPSRIGKTSISVGVEIRRDYYLPEKCVLCDVRQPKVEVHRAADFRVVTPEQMTPYDFWEMIKETNALKRSDKDPRGKPLLYRIDTAEITRRYGGWLTNIIARRYEERFPTPLPDAICTVAEPAGEAFARLVSKALGIRRVVPVLRRDLHRTGASGLPTDVTSPFDRHDRVLLVDDGINNGETMRKLVQFCRAADAELVGALVLDSRLNEEGVSKMEHLLGDRPVFALYSWPAAGL